MLSDCLQKALGSSKIWKRKCHNTKNLLKKLRKNKNSGFDSSLNLFECKGGKDYPVTSSTEDLLNKAKSNIYSERNEMMRKEGKYTSHKSWRNRLKNKEKKEEKVKHKGNEIFLQNVKHFRKGERKIHSRHRNFFFHRKAFLKPKSVLHEIQDDEITKEKSGNLRNRSCLKGEISDKNCENVLKKSNAEGVDNAVESGMQNVSGGWLKTNKKDERKRLKEKPKSWPHFIYHRVSSNFLHPEVKGLSGNHSAFVAISVDTSANTGK